MAHVIDGAAVYKVFEPFVAVGAHYQETGLVAGYNFGDLPGSDPVPQFPDNLVALLTDLPGITIQVGLIRFRFLILDLAAVKSCRHTFHYMYQHKFCLVTALLQRLSDQSAVIFAKINGNSNGVIMEVAFRQIQRSRFGVNR